MTPKATVKRTVGRKRKAEVDLEAEAEEHQKRREAQYQSLLAPSPQPPPAPLPVPVPLATPTLPVVVATVATPVSMPDHSLTQFQVPVPPAVESVDMPDVMTPSLVEPPAPAMVEMENLENMGYDQTLSSMGMSMNVEETFPGLPAQTPGALSERAPPTPWHDDYEMAPSVGPVSLSSLNYYSRAAATVTPLV